MPRGVETCEDGHGCGLHRLLDISIRPRVRLERLERCMGVGRAIAWANSTPWFTSWVALSAFALPLMSTTGHRST